jgi:hypothetical protein
MITIPEGFSVVIRSCKTGGISRDGFVWPTEIGAEVECSDWSTEPICGQGLFGLLPGQNDPGVWYDDLVLALLVETQTIVNLGGKVKFPRAQILFSGTNPETHAWLDANKLNGPWYDSTQTAGGDSTQTAGDRSTQTAGYRSTQTAGDRSTQTAGDDSTQTAGYRSTQTAGYDSTQTAGDRSTQTAGDRSTQTAGYRSTQTAGYRSTQTAGDRSTQTAGGGSVAIAGPTSKQKATNALLVCRWYDHKDSKYKFATAIAGVDVEDDVFYTYDLNSATWQKAEQSSEVAE